jgi:ferrochelatase
LCYRRQSFETAKLIAESLGLPNEKFSVGFQSRLGPNEWIQPDTVEVVKDLAKAGKKRIVVICPSFIADCLETLEEVQIRLKEDFIECGGQEFFGLPCLNAQDHWVQAAKEILCAKPNSI